VDGGKGQLGVAVEVVNELGLADEIPVAAIAKKFEEIYVPGRSEPIRIPRGSESLFMLQRIRDEAHRFANTFHRESRSKRMVASSLEGVEGLGEARAKRLVKELGSVKAIKSTSLEDLIAISWLPAKVARSVFMHLHKDVAPIEETVEGDDA
jgi:excinuclease ABC subunit C